MRPDDLCVIHFPFSGDPGIFELVDQRAANAFDLGARFVTAEYRDGPQKLYGQEVEPVYATTEILNPVRVFRAHSIISMPLRLQWRADHACRMQAREAASFASFVRPEQRVAG